MKINSLIGLFLILFGTCAILIISMFLISSLWQNQKIQEMISPLIDKLTFNKLPLKDFIQTTISIFAILIAIFALTKDSIRDNESSKRYSESVHREKVQHKEIVNVYQKQVDLLEKYSENADSMLEMLKKQASIADLQFENQKILTQPGVNINFQIQDTLKTIIFYDNDKWIMPEIICKLYNFGSRSAKDVSLTVRVISPVTRKVHYFDQSIHSYLYPNATLESLYFPVIDYKDKNFFLFVIYLEWIDEFNNNKLFQKHIFQKCIREKSNFYTIGEATGEHLELIETIIKEPRKIVKNDPIIREFMYKTFNK